jgi:hypothetical protein
MRVSIAHWPIARKLALACLLFGVVPVAIIVPLGLKGVAASARERAADRLRETAGHLADKIDRNLFERYGDVQAFGLNDVVLDRTQWYRTSSADNGIAQRINAYVDAYDIYPLAMFVDANGRLVAVNDADAQGSPVASEGLYGTNYADRTWFRACISGASTTRMAFSDPANTTASGTVITAAHADDDVRAVYGAQASEVIGFSAPVRDRDGMVIGCWHNLASVSLVGDMLAAASADLQTAGYPGAILLAVDSTGHPLAASGALNALDAETVASAFAPAVSALVAGKSGHLPAALAEVPMEVGFAHLRGALGYPGMNWGVLIAAPQGEIDAAANLARHDANGVDAAPWSSPCSSWAWPSGLARAWPVRSPAWRRWPVPCPWGDSISARSGRRTTKSAPWPTRSTALSTRSVRWPPPPQAWPPAIPRSR